MAPNAAMRMRRPFRSAARCDAMFSAFGEWPSPGGAGSGVRDAGSWAWSSVRLPVAGGAHRVGPLGALLEQALGPLELVGADLAAREAAAQDVERLVAAGVTPWRPHQQRDDDDERPASRRPSRASPRSPWSSPSSSGHPRGASSAGPGRRCQHPPGTTVESMKESPRLPQDWVKASGGGQLHAEGRARGRGRRSPPRPVRPSPRRAPARWPARCRSRPSARERDGSTR